MHTTCRIRDDGIKVIYKEQLHDAVPEWRYLSEEAQGLGGQGRAPDAASLISAGIGLCFMTQMGRYSSMTKKSMKNYAIIQDTHFSLGGASHGTGEAGTAEPVETHVYIDSDLDDEVAHLAFVRPPPVGRTPIATRRPWSASIFGLTLASKL
mgnify:CR=1 FL=1